MHTLASLIFLSQALALPIYDGGHSLSAIGRRLAALQDRGDPSSSTFNDLFKAAASSDIPGLNAQICLALKSSMKSFPAALAALPPACTDPQSNSSGPNRPTLPPGQGGVVDGSPSGVPAALPQSGGGDDPVYHPPPNVHAAQPQGDNDSYPYSGTYGSTTSTSSSSYHEPYQTKSVTRKPMKATYTSKAPSRPMHSYATHKSGPEKSKSKQTSGKTKSYASPSKTYHYSVSSYTHSGSNPWHTTTHRSAHETYSSSETPCTSMSSDYSPSYPSETSSYPPDNDSHQSGKPYHPPDNTSSSHPSDSGPSYPSDNAPEYSPNGAPSYASHFEPPSTDNDSGNCLINCVTKIVDSASGSGQNAPVAASPSDQSNSGQPVIHLGNSGSTPGDDDSDYNPPGYAPSMANDGLPYSPADGSSNSPGQQPADSSTLSGSSSPSDSSAGHGPSSGNGTPSSYYPNSGPGGDNAATNGSNVPSGSTESNVSEPPCDTPTPGSSGPTFYEKDPGRTIIVSAGGINQPCDACEKNNEQ